MNIQEIVKEYASERKNALDKAGEALSDLEQRITNIHQSTLSAQNELRDVKDHELQQLLLNSQQLEAYYLQIDEMEVKLRTSVAQNEKQERTERKLGFATLNQHLLTIDELSIMYPFSGLNNNQPELSSGLTAQHIEVLRQKHGLNKLTSPPQISKLVLCFKNYNHPLMILLNVAGWISLVIFFFQQSEPVYLYLAIVLFVIVIGMCTFIYFQGRASPKLKKSFKQTIPSKCIAVRAGKRVQINQEYLVPGDLVEIKAGDKVPADIRLIHCSNLKVDCYSITGEETVVCNDRNSQPGTPSNESKNIIYSDSLCMDGQGFGIVIATGDKSIIGQIAKSKSKGVHQQSKKMI